MQILIPHTINNSATANPYVRVLRDGLADCGHSVECSAKLFWESPLDWDLIFFQWPESILNQDKTKPCLEQISDHIEKIKNNGVKICITVHNLHPHLDNPFVSKVYDYLYSKADLFHHMGEFSRNLFENKYPNATHFIAPHPIYYDVEKLGISVDECKIKYDVNRKKITIISFGAFRNADERDMILNLNKMFSNEICFWAPKLFSNAFTKKQSKNKVINKISTFVNYAKYSLQGIKMNRGIISDNDVLPMVNAADILLIQRQDILNSGNLPLGFSAKKIVVGPNIGNVGTILSNTGNPVFNPHDKDSLYDAISEAMKLFRRSNYQGISNYLYAKDNWTIDRVAQIINNTLITL